MIHSLYLEYNWAGHEKLTFPQLKERAMADGISYFRPATTTSMTVLLTTSQNMSSDYTPSDLSKFKTHVTITYDDSKDKDTSAFKNLSGGRSIPVPSH